MDTKVHLHRFRDRAALAITGSGAETVYLTPEQTRKLARNLARLARSLERESFREHTFACDPVGCARFECL